MAISISNIASGSMIVFGRQDEEEETEIRLLPRRGAEAKDLLLLAGVK